MRHKFVLFWVILASMACSLTQRDDRAETQQSLQSRPLVVLLSPVNKIYQPTIQTYAEGTRIELYALAEDHDVGVKRVEFRVDEMPVGEMVSDQPNGQIVLEARSEWVASGVSGHQISVEAFRADGSSLGSNELTFAAIQVVQNPIEQFPTVSQLVNGTLIPLSNSSPTQVMTPAGTPSPSQATGSPQPQTTALPTNTPHGTGPTALVTVSSLNVRQGPGVSYPPVGYLAYGEQVQIVGRNTDSSWWAIPFEGGTAWILSEFTSVDGDTSQVPLAAPN